MPPTIRELRSKNEKTSIGWLRLTRPSLIIVGNRQGKEPNRRRVARIIRRTVNPQQSSAPRHHFKILAHHSRLRRFSPSHSADAWAEPAACGWEAAKANALKMSGHWLWKTRPARARRRSMCSCPSSIRKRCETYHNDPASAGHSASSFTASFRVQTTKSELPASAARSRASARVNA